MLIITSKDDFKRGFTVEGHAQFDVEGKDIVCSAISALTQVFTMGLREYGRTFSTSQKGYMDVLIEEPNRDTVILTNTLKKGLEAVEQAFPEYVKIT